MSLPIQVKISETAIAPNGIDAYLLPWTENLFANACGEMYGRRSLRGVRCEVHAWKFEHQNMFSINFLGKDQRGMLFATKQEAMDIIDKMLINARYKLLTQDEAAKYSVLL